jgi:hypothetical protein
LLFLYPGSGTLSTDIYAIFSPTEVKLYNKVIGNHSSGVPSKYVHAIGYGVPEVNAVSLTSFTGINKDVNVNKLDWETAQEIGTAGYYLRRASDSVTTHSTRCSEFIVAIGESAGAKYTTYDTLGEYFNKAYYWLEEIESDQSSHYYGPISIETGAHLQVCKDYAANSTQQTLAFSQGIWGDPVCFSSVGTSNQTDPVSIRVKAIQNTTTSGSISLFLEEERSLDPEILHTNETIGFMGWNAGMISDSGNCIIGETGKVAVNSLPPINDIPVRNGSDLTDNLHGQWRQLDLRKSYTNAIVIMQLGTRNDTDFCHTRIQSVTGNKLIFQLEEWDYQDGLHSQEIIDYLVIEKGSYQLMNGVKIIANRGQAGSSATNIVFPVPFSKIPVVVHGISSLNSIKAVESRGTAAATIAGMQVKSQEQELNQTIHPLENISYLATEFPAMNAIVITKQPGSLTVPLNGNGNFCCNATSALPLRYRWEVSKNGGISWSVIFGTETNPSYEGYGTKLIRLKNIPLAANGYLYRCCISNMSNRVYTATAPLIVDYLPNAPSQLTVQWNYYPGVKNYLAIRWMDNSTNETGFAIERSVDGGPFIQIATVQANTVYYSDKVYYDPNSNCLGYRVRAYNLSGYSAYSNENYAGPCLKSAVMIEETQSDNEVTVYPNPFTDEVTLKFWLDKQDKVTIEIFTLNGQKVFEVSNKEFSMGINEEKLDCGNLKEGIYVYRITTSGSSKTGKLCKNR